MRWSIWPLLALLAVGTSEAFPQGDEKPRAIPTDPAARAVEKLAESARPALVVITVVGRDGKRQGLGTGFVVAADGLIATNLHVIGEARPITVEMADGKRHDVTAIHASDRSLDLALIRIDAKGLVPLELGDSTTLKQGQPVVALGNPQGLNYSVVSGVVSGLREIGGQSMIQLAIPLEPGNSGGPLLDLRGRVQGILTLKSMVTANLGFAVGIDALKPLLKKPNPIPMARWLTIGALDPEEWTTAAGARWRQRAGRIVVDGFGSGFGGRSLCLAKRTPPPVPYELAVQVQLADEAGAAGLVFHADGKDRHYGFYPTNGKLRLTRFEGPDVFSWKVLQEEHSPHYRPGEWNTLKIRVEKERLRCYVNGQLVIESNDTELTGGLVGLCKFRDTHAEFKGFQAAPEVPASRVPADVTARITKTVEGIAPQGPPKPEMVDALLPDANVSLHVLRDRARLLEQQAAQLRQLAQTVHLKRVQGDLAKALQGKEEEIDLFRAALTVARLDNDEIEEATYRRELERMGRAITAQLPAKADDQARIEALNKYFFTERGFHGSRADYYNRSNSYLNEVIDDREGLPITLSILYMEVGRQIGLKFEGVGLPGHFVVQHVPAKGEKQLIDVYEGGQPLSREDAARRVLAITGRELKDEDLVPVTKRAIVIRMLHNLVGIARGERDAAGMLRYLDPLVALDPTAGAERWTRALVRLQLGDRQGALEDADWLLDHRPPGIDIERVLEFRKLVNRPGR